MKALEIFDDENTSKLRKVMVEHLFDYYGAKELSSQEVRKAMLEVPRHIFIPWHDPETAYANVALPSLKGQTISQPYIVALMTQLLMPLDGKKVLEIGTGTGYQTAILAHLGAEVHSVEIVKELHEHAKGILEKLCKMMKWKHCPRLYLGDGSLGLPGEAPFDRIIITAAVPDITQELLEQLSYGGVIVAPVGTRGHQILYRVKKSKNRLLKESHGAVIFVPMKGKAGFE